MGKIQSVEAVIFDLDGTLLDTIEDLAEAMNAALTHWNFPVRTIEECKYLVGKGLDAFVEEALPAHARDDDTIAAIKQDYSAMYAQGWANNTKPYPGVLNMLNTLCDLQIPLAVLSNKNDELVQESVQRFLPARDFADIRGAQPSVPLKPDPAAALDIAQNLNASPSRTVLVGDTHTDMRTATAAGMIPIGVLWGFRTAEELQDNGAQALAETPTDVCTLIE